jgi:predicted mannosyl-3-phosphoglycerate phosphatase (HAD superfamily)
MLDKLNNMVCRDVSDYLNEIANMYGTATLKAPEVITLQTEKCQSPAALTTFGQQMETIHWVSGESQMPQWTARPGSSHVRLVSGKLQSYK